MNKVSNISPSLTISELITSICEESTSDKDNNPSIINKILNIQKL